MPLPMDLFSRHTVLRRANAARDDKRWADAVRDYDAYLARNPRKGHIWVQAGHCRKEVGDLDGAFDAYSRAGELLGDNADLYLHIGHLALLDHRRADAVAAYVKAIELAPGMAAARAALDSLGHGLLVRPGHDRACNRAEAATCPDLVEASADALADFIRRLPRPLADSEPGRIPRMLHFVYGFKDKGDLPYYGGMAIRSALHFNPGWKAFYYTMHPPEGPNWDSIKHLVEVVTVSDFTHFGDARIHHYAHKADIVRMLVINRVGGAYLDLDTITQKSFEDLRGHEFVMGVQAAGPDSSSGLCNAIMFGQPGARFSSRWLAEYDYFRSQGRDDLWDYHSVKLPVSLAARHPDEITVLDYRALFYPLWGTIRKTLFEANADIYADDLACAYAFHLWNGATGSWLDRIDREFVNSSPSLYARIARQVEECALSLATAG